MNIEFEAKHTDIVLIKILWYGFVIFCIGLSTTLIVQETLPDIATTILVVVAGFYFALKNLNDFVKEVLHWHMHRYEEKNPEKALEERKKANQIIIEMYENEITNLKKEDNHN